MSARVLKFSGFGLTVVRVECDAGVVTAAPTTTSKSVELLVGADCRAAQRYTLWRQPTVCRRHGPSPSDAEVDAAVASSGAANGTAGEDGSGDGVGGDDDDDKRVEFEICPNYRGSTDAAAQCFRAKRPDAITDAVLRGERPLLLPQHRADAPPGLLPLMEECWDVCLGCTAVDYRCQI